MVFPSDEFSETEERFEYVLTNSREIEWLKFGRIE
jgi:hypothetical protein